MSDGVISRGQYQIVGDPLRTGHRDTTAADGVVSPYGSRIAGEGGVIVGVGVLFRRSPSGTTSRPAVPITAW